MGFLTHADPAQTEESDETAVASADGAAVVRSDLEPRRTLLLFN